MLPTELVLRLNDKLILRILIHSISLNLITRGKKETPSLKDCRCHPGAEVFQKSVLVALATGRPCFPCVVVLWLLSTLGGFDCVFWAWRFFQVVGSICRDNCFIPICYWMLTWPQVAGCACSIHVLYARQQHRHQYVMVCLCVARSIDRWFD